MSEKRILVVDDEALNIEILVEYFDGETGFFLDAADCGESAWEKLQSPESNYHLILLDRMMPGLDGIGLLKLIKASPRLAGIPVILQTAANSASQIREGLEAGAYYYLTKPYRRDALMAIVHAALTDAEARDALRLQLTENVLALQFMTRGSFKIRTVSEARQLASFVAQSCPQPDVAAIGISELLVNGIEHGNLGLSYVEKTRLKLLDGWTEELERRSQLPENSGKSVSLEFVRNDEEIEIRVTDQGAGFDWQKYLEMDPARAFDPNGRGIALARMLSFLDIHYEGCGNIAIARISCALPPGAVGPA